MKIRPTLSIVASVLVMGLTSCETTPPAPAPTSRPAAKVGDISNEEAEQPPFVGMTKAQALARYGEPKTRGVTDEGENWVYILNFGEAMGRAFIPFNFKPTPIRTGTLTFGADGKLKKFNWDVPTEG